MATCSSRSLEGGHDAENDYCCTSCSAKASFFCKTCSRLFCCSCNKHHDKILKDHQVLGEKEIANWGNFKAVETVLMCEKHPNEEEKMYCVDHDLVCCHICISKNHRYVLVYVILILAILTYTCIDKRSINTGAHIYLL